MKLGSRQILFFLAAVAPVGKLILLPPQLAAVAGNDLLFPVLAQLLVQAALVFCVLLLSRRERTVYALLEGSIGGVGAKIVTWALALFLLYASFMPLVEQKLLVQSIFYDTIPSYIVFAPFFLLAAYLCSRPLAYTGRIWDILAPLAIFGMAGILLFSVGEADYGAILPVGAAGLPGFSGGVMRTCAWFFDAALLLPFVGRFDYKKGLAWKGAVCYLAGGAVLLFFLATFYGVFSDISVIQVFAFAKM
ncbi:MAG TPA: GerAB/ArcD/ProY family transporter, partial [Candidatus Gallimonas intestinigallinarum]|nr:GerAB/ArcD/ProY family transporter [Candidatus Gallimonas intestinigallinarum]